jgi:hypothetical protein
VSRHPSPYNASDPDKVREAAQREKSVRDLELEDFKFLMSTPQGRRFMTRMLDITGFQRSSFTRDSTTFFNEGARSVGLQIWGDMQEFPDLFMKMLLENMEKRNARR